MADRMTPEQRRRNMEAIGSEDTEIEVRLRKALWHRGHRGYRVNWSELPGKPDIVYTKHDLVIFVDGCFWHGCPDCYREPDTNQEFWKEKLEYNKRRDRENEEELKEGGWTVLRFWGHEVKESLGECVQQVEKVIES